MKVSFDFDGTLDNPFVQGYAASLVSQGHDVWIVTARYFEGLRPGIKFENKDLYNVAMKVGIPRENVIFCNMTLKWKTMQDKDFVWHLDDDNIELREIAKNTKTGAIDVKSATWLGHCERIIKEHSK